MAIQATSDRKSLLLQVLSNNFQFFETSRDKSPDRTKVAIVQFFALHTQTTNTAATTTTTTTTTNNNNNNNNNNSNNTFVGRHKCF
jgi:hypothetical protein